MNRYVSTGPIKARPMAWGEYLEYINSAPTERDFTDAEGYFVEYDGDRTTWLPKAFLEAAYIKYNAEGFEPHQQRVIAEKAQLDDKRNKLVEFFSTPIFVNLPTDEKIRLETQAMIMNGYSDVLADRIHAFTHCSGTQAVS